MNTDNIMQAEALDDLHLFLGLCNGAHGDDLRRCAGQALAAAARYALASGVPTKDALQTVEIATWIRKGGL